jgi:hypothetical protein
MSRECIDVRNGCKKGIKAYLDMEIQEWINKIKKK